MHSCIHKNDIHKWFSRNLGTFFVNITCTMDQKRSIKKYTFRRREFPNVPLLGIQGGITYNPILARRQFSYPMKERPASILVSGIFYLNQDGNSDMRNRFVRAWHHVDRRRHLGTKQCVALKDYTDWVQARAHTFQMP